LFNTTGTKPDTIFRGGARDFLGVQKNKVIEGKSCLRYYTYHKMIAVKMVQFRFLGVNNKFWRAADPRLPEATCLKHDIPHLFILFYFVLFIYL